MSLPRTIPSPEDAVLIALGRKVRELLASEECPRPLAERLLGALTAVPRVVSLGTVAWAWFREQLLGDLQTPSLGSLQTDGATAERLGPLVVYDGLGFRDENGGFHHAHKDILQEAADAWNREQNLMAEIRQQIRRQSEAEEDANGR